MDNESIVRSRTEKETVRVKTSERVFDLRPAAAEALMLKKLQSRGYPHDSLRRSDVHVQTTYKVDEYKGEHIWVTEVTWFEAFPYEQ